MLQTIQAILAMLKEQEEALVTAEVENTERDRAMVKLIQEEGNARTVQLSAMLGNVRLAIRKIEGGNGEVTHG